MASFASSYIKTEASQVTRSADAASMTGANFTSWYRADEGTLYAEVVLNHTPAANTFPTFFDVNNGTISNRVQVATNSSRNLRGQVVINGTFNTLLTANSYTISAPSKTVLAYKSLDNAAVGNGGIAVVNTSVVTPNNLTQAIIGDQATSGASINGTIRKLAYYPKRLTNAQLQALTA